MISIIKIAFSVFGVVYILRYTDGPFDVFLRFRELVGIHMVPIYEADRKVGEVEEVEDVFLAKLFGCFWCLSVWVALFCVLLYDVIGVVFDWLAVIGIAGFLHEFVAMREF